MRGARLPRYVILSEAKDLNHEGDCETGGQPARCKAQNPHEYAAAVPIRERGYLEEFRGRLDVRRTVSDRQRVSADPSSRGG